MKKYIAAFIVFFTAFGIVVEVLTASFEDGSTFFTGFRLFRYYTIQSNLIVAIYFSALLSNKYRNSLLFKKILGGVTVYVTITFIIFAVMLQKDFHPQGINFVTNIFLHYLVPILTMFFLIYYRKEYSFNYRDTVLWMIYPLIYILFMVIYGSITGDYLYPFFDVAVVGISGLIIAIIGLIIFFIIMSFLYVKIVSKKELTKQ